MRDNEQEYRLCECGCGKKVYRKHNSTIFPKLHPNCELKKAAKKSKQNLKTKTPKSKKINKELDNAWSELVKLLAGHKCEKCGNKKTLNSHHIYTRKNYSVRWKTINGVCLCSGCHTLSSKFSAHGTPMLFSKWIIDKRGEKFMNDLELMAHNDSHYSIPEKQIILSQLLKEIEKLKSKEK